jgi:uncharacterized Ntn-hydrolase superfamily protein
MAVHTGAECIPFASHVVGSEFSCQANMMAREGVPEAMAAAFEAAQGPLAERLVAALDGAEDAGGDVRGRQSAALLVVPAAGHAWDRLELRVEDHADPIAELRRVLRLARAYGLATKGDDAAAAADADAACRYYVEAAELAPESDELQFWAGLSLVDSGDREAGLAAVRRAVAVHAGWLDLLGRLPDELAPGAAVVLAALRA